MPKNKRKQIFDLVIVVLLIYTATLVPYFTCFVDDISDFRFVFDLCVDFLFFIDIILNFLTGYELQNGVIEVRKCKIAINYIKGFFFIDLITTMPFQLIEKF